MEYNTVNSIARENERIPNAMRHTYKPVNNSVSIQKIKGSIIKPMLKIIIKVL